MWPAGWRSTPAKIEVLCMKPAWSRQLREIRAPALDYISKNSSALNRSLETRTLQTLKGPLRFEQPSNSPRSTRWGRNATSRRSSFLESWGPEAPRPKAMKYLIPEPYVPLHQSPPSLEPQAHQNPTQPSPKHTNERSPGTPKHALYEM